MTGTKGFTLLELLFVIAIIGSIALWGIHTYRQHTIRTKIERTVSGIQEILKAGTHFFLNQGKLPNSDHPSDLFQKEYLLNGEANKNPWDNPYHYEPFLGISTEVEKARLFQVSTRVPTESIAHQIASKLFNAQVVEKAGHYEVNAQIVLPGAIEQHEKSAQYIIYSMGFKKLKKENKMKSYAAQVYFDPPCPHQMKPDVLIGLIGVHASERIGFETLATLEVVDKICNLEKCEFRVSLRYFSITCLPDNNCWTDNNKEVMVSYIQYCKAKSTSMKE